MFILQESFKSQAYHGLNKADILTNEYYTEISKNSSFSRTANRSNMKRECSVQGGSYIYVNNEHKRLGKFGITDFELKLENFEWRQLKDMYAQKVEDYVAFF